MVMFHNPKWKRIKAFIDRLIQSLLKGTYHHYACYLPPNPGRLVSHLQKLFYRGITLAPSQIAVLKPLPRNAVLICVTKRKSLFQWLFYHARYRDKHIPAPTLAFDYTVFLYQPLSRIFRMLLARLDYFCRHFSFPDPYSAGYYQDMLSRGETAFLSLVEPGGFYRRFVKQKTDPIQFLLDFQSGTDRPVYLVPHLMIFEKDPEKSNPSLWSLLFGPEKALGFVRRLATLVKKPGRTFVELSTPVDLTTFMQHPEVRDRRRAYQALLLRRNLLRQINRHRQSILGPILKNRLELKESVLTGSRLQDFIREQAQSENQPITKLHKKAEDYFEEIAADYRISMIKICEKVLTWIINTMFDGFIVDNEGLDRLKTMSQRGPLVLLPCHKSHIDYLMLSYVMYSNNMPCPHIVAGKNLSFWPIGTIFRRSGAFFMRRTFKGQPLYAAVFAAYVHKLLQEGFNIEVFIERGRRRTGKLLSPKTGLLSILLEAYQKGACDDLILAPIFMGYDKVPEEKAYLHELEGGKKEPESLMQVIRARKMLQKRFGKIYIEFHDPISLRGLLRKNDLELESMTHDEISAFCRNIAHRSIHAINRVAVITPHAVTAAALLNYPAPGITLPMLLDTVDTYLNHLQFHDVKLADTLLVDPAHAIEQVFNIYIQRKFIEPLDKSAMDAENPPRFRINSEKRPSLEYYKNNCVACFVPATFTALAIIAGDAFQFSTTDLHRCYRFLQDLLKYEFSYDLENPPEWHVRKNIKAFINDAILIPHPNLPDTYNITSAGFRRLKLFSSFLRSYFESYWITLNQLMHQKPGEIAIKDQLKKIAAQGARMAKSGEIERNEALSRVNFKNALAFFNSRGIHCLEDETAIAQYREPLQRYLDFLR
ncbi:MAG: 1-acyl-sn-glycerol-3-phosphate acyltransferase [Desulfosarcina sp.]|nr:1-acyl-sn-glycerol-3-phosphate acyltransferase [Desulfobacterales bacterium]